MSFNIAVIGAGAMGTAISQCIAENGYDVLLYARNKEVSAEINNLHYNLRYFPNLKLNSKIKSVNNFKELKDSDVIFLCIPSSVMRATVSELTKYIKSDCILVSTAKGIESQTNKRMSEIIEELTENSAVVLSGPNIAFEMANGLSTATSIASSNEDYLFTVKKILESKKFKIDYRDDVIGTEYCGVIKNILAISQGICEGLDINYNSRFALFTKSFQEVKDIINLLGGKKDTVDNYCGFGDIITASILNVSRNHTLGVLYGQGIKIDEQTTGVLFEGKNTVIIFKKICDELNFNSLTVNFVYDVLINNKNSKLAFNEFWERI